MFESSITSDVETTVDSSLHPSDYEEDAGFQNKKIDSHYIQHQQCKAATNKLFKAAKLFIFTV